MASFLWPVGVRIMGFHCTLYEIIPLTIIYDLESHNSNFIWTSYFSCYFVSAPGKRKAGKYGDYSCDIPPITLESMLQHINATHQVIISSINYLICT